MSAGMNSSRNTPLLGLAFLISAITAAWPAVILARSAPSKSRVSTRLSASKRTTSSGFFLRAAAISSCLTATILLRMSLMGLIFLGWGRLQHLLDDPVHHHTGHDEQQRDANGDPGAFVLQPDGHMPLLQGPVPARRGAAGGPPAPGPPPVGGGSPGLPPPPRAPPPPGTPRGGGRPAT